MDVLMPHDSSQVDPRDLPLGGKPQRGLHRTPLNISLTLACLDLLKAIAQREQSPGLHHDSSHLSGRELL